MMSEPYTGNVMLIDAENPNELRVALVNKHGELTDYDVQYAEHNQTLGNIYLGEITKIVRSLNAVFVSYGDKNLRHGFLPFSEITRHYYVTTTTSGNLLVEKTLPISPSEGPSEADLPTSETEAPEGFRDLAPSEPQYDADAIAAALKEGQKIVVQVVKEERDTKGAALTTDISFAGSYLVLMPLNDRAAGVSRRIEGPDREQMREILRNLKVPEGMGVIIRTAGLNKTLEQLQWDLEIQVNLWRAVQRVISQENRPGSFLIHKDNDLVTRALRDYLRPEISKVIFNDKASYDQASQYLEAVRPDYLDRLVLDNKRPPLFTRPQYQVEQQIVAATERRVQLKSGGNIVIDVAEALTAIDVNSAGSTKNEDIETTALHTNLEAAEEIARQLRIRGLGGLIVIDFIDMPLKDQRKVENHFRECMRQDRARIQMGRISPRFGLLELSRQRLRPSLDQVSRVTCPRCDGQGTIQNVESLVNTLIRLIQESILKEPLAQLQLQLPIEVATLMVNEKRAELNALEKEYDISILIVPNINLQTPQYRMKRIRSSGHTGTPKSYCLVESSMVQVPTGKKTDLPAPEFREPAVRAVLPAPQPPKPSIGLIRRLWDNMLGVSHVKKTGQGEKTPVPSIEPPVAEPSRPPRNGRRAMHRKRYGNSGNARNEGRRPPRPRLDSSKPSGEVPQKLLTAERELVVRLEEDKQPSSNTTV